MSAYPDDGHHSSGCFGRGGRRPPSSQGNGSHRSLWNLPPLSVFRSSRPTAEPSHSYDQNQSQPERRNEYNDPLSDPSSTWSNYNTMGQQSAFPDEDDPRLHYSYPAPPQVQQPYQSFRDPSPSYSNHPILPPINVSGSHLRDERWQPNPYGGTSAATRIPEPDFSPVASYPAPSFQYPPQHHSQGMLPDNRFLPVNPPTSPSTGSRRGPTLVERTRSSAHTTSPYSRQAPAQVAPVQVATQEHPPPKKKRKRADAEQLRVLNEVYARTAFPSTEERQDLAGKLNMTPRSVQIWFQNKRQSMRNTHRQSTSVRGTGSNNPPGAHHSGSSRSGPSSVSTIQMPPPRAGSVSANSQQTTYITPSPTDVAYFSLSRPSQTQQGASGQYRSPSRNRGNPDDYYDGGGSRRNRV
ncbi:hypothetical protein BJ322DRAFT_49631 [Thelephora terrestris]|uniref:Homeobox domain-containing protein n=1 Tax=Thelephora terrestris TaxID=56493 RepID=A0A9P6LCM8_9AGAM|nr:hypothetical protein BJ322DRAFT_49631 [Thelephora terrestris]